MSEKIIVLHPENQPEVDIYPIIKEGSIPNSVIDNQKIKSRTIINSNIALNTLKYEVLHQTLKDLIDSKITQTNMENYLTSYYYNVEETQQYVGSEINTLHQTIQNEFYSNTTIDNMLMEKTDLSLFRQYLPGTFLDLDKQQDNQTSKLNIHADGSIFLMNSGNKINSGNYYLPNSIVKTEDAPNGYYVLSTTYDDYQSLYNLGVYDKITTNSDGTYTITRQTGYLNSNDLLDSFIQVNWDSKLFEVDIPLSVITDIGQQSQLVNYILNDTTNYTKDNVYSSGSNNHSVSISNDKLVIKDTSSDINTLKQYLLQHPLIVQYKLKTATNEKVEKNHNAAYNQKFILEHNKNEAERSANLLDNSLLNKTAGTGQFAANGIPFVLEPGTYTISLNGSSTSITIALQNANGGDLFTPVDFNNNTTKTFTISEKSAKLFLYNVSWTNANYNIMLNEGTTPLPYQPYEGKTIHEKDLENVKNEINNAKQDKLLNEINIKSINGNSILGSGSLNIVADGVYTKITEGVNHYDLEWGKTYKIKMNSDDYAYCSSIPNIKFYGTFEITNFSIRYSDQGTGVGIVGPEYDYILSANGNRYLASQGQDVKRGTSATTHSKPPIRLSAYGGSTFAVYLLK